MKKHPILVKLGWRGTYGLKHRILNDDDYDESFESFMNHESFVSGPTRTKGCNPNMKGGDDKLHIFWLALFISIQYH